MVAIKQHLKPFVSCEEQRAKELLQAVSWDRHSLGAVGILRRRILSPAWEAPHLDGRKCGLCVLQEPNRMMVQFFQGFPEALQPALTDRRESQAPIHYRNAIVIQTDSVYLYEAQY